MCIKEVLMWFTATYFLLLFLNTKYYYCNDLELLQDRLSSGQVSQEGDGKRTIIQDMKVKICLCFFHIEYISYSL